MAQSRIVAEALTRAGVVARLDDVEIVEVRTRGDDLSARRPAGHWEASDGQFTTELERALREDRVDLVVHSYKDLPTGPTPGLMIAAVLERGDARDCLLTRDGHGLDGLTYGASVATSSVRRASQLAALRADLVVQPIRGNVDSRLRRLAEGEFDGLLVAAAGLDRLGLSISESDSLSFEQMLPAPAQGALAVQIRAEDSELGQELSALDHASTRIAVEAERALLREVGGGCLAPLGAIGEVSDGILRLRAAYDAGAGFVRADVSAPADAPADAVREAASRLVAGPATVA